jgi:surface antigen
MFGKDDGKPEYSGSITARPVSAKTAARAAEGDLALAKRAATEVLARGTDASQPWENPRTGARGTVTPLASSYAQDGTVCHDFLTSYVQGDQESWYQGGACRHGGTWEVRDLRPLQRT